MECKPEAFLGVDPGANGAICLLVPGKDLILFADHNEILLDLIEWVKLMNQTYDIKLAHIEDVHSLGNMSAKSNFSFGRNVERAHVILMVPEVPYKLVTPKDWHSKVGVVVAKDIKGKLRKIAIKHKVAELCMSIYPTCEIYGSKGGLMDGRSDALMIAHYSYLTFKEGK